MRINSSAGLVPAFKSWIDDFWGADSILDDDFFRSRKSLMPSVNIKDKSKTFEIELAAPGMEKDDFDVSVENGLLCISAEKEASKEEKEENYTRKEFSYNSFKRSFTLPENADAEGITAKYTNGVLKLSLKKVKVEEAKKAKHIKVA